MTSEKLSAWLTLSFTPYLGGNRLSRLLRYGSAEEIINFTPERLRGLGFKEVQISFIKDKARAEVESCLKWRERSHDQHIITSASPDYPPLLKEISAFPPVLFIKGNPSVLSEPQLAIVGSRNASVHGLNHARQFARDLAQKGLTITSGMALGVDGYAHDGALAGEGNTIAVLGSGLDNLYPKRHKKLAQRIIENGGALVSEFRPDAFPRPEHFPRRNRIISGMSLGVLVVEAAEKSGSLITARYALEQGREVFALPGSINSPGARGCNALIKEGACLVQSSSDILTEVEYIMTWSANRQKDLFHHEADNEELPFTELLANVGIEEATPVDILAERTNIPVNEIMMQLLELELQGHVAAVSGGYIRTRRG
ncbi:DNA-processing protein DprA [Vibrio sp. JC009]|uniref:DNA-processing protein DprA n=1 Tax=Vibrio sp. JC009 TaxID=2912314 RepID=UPI0023B189AB|nr:DNA-processing protein DprA [Vibrio sp. JC009]WED21809.1 DNA-processing protein DprA [Vibrio sp. JC009]